MKQKDGKEVVHYAEVVVGNVGDNRHEVAAYAPRAVVADVRVGDAEDAGTCKDSPLEVPEVDDVAPAAFVDEEGTDMVQLQVSAVGRTDGPAGDERSAVVGDGRRWLGCTVH